jgi:hypothetical protein
VALEIEDTRPYMRGVLCVVQIYKIQGLAADESVQIAMKIVANCEKGCELQ